MYPRSFKVGDYTVRYSDREATNPMPSEIFFDCKTEAPFIYQENFIRPKDLTMMYQGALEAFPGRNFATVHDYSKGVTAAKVDTNGRYTHFIPCKQEIYDYLEKTLTDRIYPALLQAYDIKGSFRRREGWQVLGYGEGYFFGNHCDNCVSGSTAPDPAMHAHPWWCNSSDRKFTILMYLNDHKADYAPSGSYSGGELLLTRVYDKNNQIVTFRPKAGSLIAFPSNFYFQHEVRKVLRGYRFSCVTWVDVVQE